MTAALRTVAADAQARAGARFRTTAVAAVRTARPRQWSKNLLVLAAPLAAWAAGRGRLAAGELALAVAAFVCVASALYFVNDLVDLERDRRHPVKRLRPLPSGALSARAALACGAGCVLAGELFGVATGRVAFSAVLSCYLLLSLGYSVLLKHVPGLELVVLASGFVLRAVGGGAAAGVPPSAWFVLVCSLGALLMAVEKRGAEVALLGAAAAAHRPVLRWYRGGWLPAARRCLIAAVPAAYLGWALGAAATPLRIWHLLSVLPLLLALLRFDRLASRRPGARVEDLMVTDRLMVAAELVWLAAFLGPAL
ncbi:decaprenyl-phosphate phosphoribosyltransferase [Phaeacidiphilus oryzae]|uniref:decaprenyl-phosphate phosphoribosyltransferase n=1 Tax=Phaeacidiphilus oryzae TaxID=348818 RepID=UPI000689B495|nr:decaprenyl-phosphate phosphoribosyltransferase [Phaeacidiphilus oryzae]